MPWDVLHSSWKNNSANDRFSIKVHDNDVNWCRIAVDPIFPLIDTQQTTKRSGSYENLNENKFWLVFDEKLDGPQLAAYATEWNSANVISKNNFLTKIEELEEEEEVNSSGSEEENK